MTESWDQEAARAAGVPWGHSIVAHQHLGWCSHCAGVTPAAECIGWRLLAQGEPMPDIERARLWSGT